MLTRSLIMPTSSLFCVTFLFLLNHCHLYQVQRLPTSVKESMTEGRRDAGPWKLGHLTLKWNLWEYPSLGSLEPINTISIFLCLNINLVSFSFNARKILCLKAPQEAPWCNFRCWLSGVMHQSEAVNQENLPWNADQLHPSQHAQECSQDSQFMHQCAGTGLELRALPAPIKPQIASESQSLTFHNSH